MLPERGSGEAKLAAVPETRPPLTLKKRVLFTVAAALLVVAGAEGLARLAYPFVVPREYETYYRELLDRTLGAHGGIAYVRHPYEGYDLLPGYEDRVMKWNNSDGFRPPEMPRARRPGVYRIACMGGSTTYDPYVGPQNTFCQLLEEYLNGAFPGRDFEVLNAGVPAYTSAETFARFHFRVLDYAPDMVVNYDGVNDVWPMLGDTGPFENDFRNARKVMEEVPPPPGETARFLATWSKLFRIAYWKIVLGSHIHDIMTLTYKHLDYHADNAKTYDKASTSAFRRNLEDTAFICKGRGIELVLCTCALDRFFIDQDPERSYPFQLILVGRLNETAKAIAREQGLSLLDFDALMPRNDPKAPPKDRYFGDVCHLTPDRGNRTKANVFGRHLAALLEKKFNTRRAPFELDDSIKPDGVYAPAHLKRR